MKSSYRRWKLAWLILRLPSHQTDALGQIISDRILVLGRAAGVGAGFRA